MWVRQRAQGQCRRAPRWRGRSNTCSAHTGHRVSRRAAQACTASRSPHCPARVSLRGPGGESRLCAAIGSRSVRRPRASAPSQPSRPAHRGHGAGRRTGRGRRWQPTPGARSPRSVARSSRECRPPAGPAPTPPPGHRLPPAGRVRTGRSTGYPLVGYPDAGGDIRHPLTGTPLPGSRSRPAPRWAWSTTPAAAPQPPEPGPPSPVQHRSRRRSAPPSTRPDATPGWLVRPPPQPKPTPPGGAA